MENTVRFSSMNPTDFVRLTLNALTQENTV